MPVDARLLEAVLRILCDIRPSGGADALYLFSQTRDNESSVIDSAKAVIDEGLTSKVLILEADESNGYTGSNAWTMALMRGGIDQRKIGLVEFLAGQPHNTLTEATALIRYAKKQGLKSIIVCAAPFHQVRAFMTCVRAAMLECPEIKIYSHPGTVLSWQAKVVHSQGWLTATRSGLIKEEFDRIDRYCRKGDLVSYTAAINYLDRRDQ
jgi:uncharacterized SAM-binding protein YcdF (DUF218 family)